jgi:hypothetical protein
MMQGAAAALLLAVCCCCCHGMAWRFKRKGFAVPDANALAAAGLAGMAVGSMRAAKSPQAAGDCPWDISRH